DLGASYAVESAGITLGAHYGKQTVANNSASDYADYSLSVSKDVGGFGLSATYSKTDLDPAYKDPQGNDLGKGQLVLAIGRKM
ncbi:MAG: TorF family putative porin, partial [Pseudomonadota bacterium]